jgi:hypothetical protein
MTWQREVQELAARGEGEGAMRVLVRAGFGELRPEHCTCDTITMKARQMGYNGTYASYIQLAMELNEARERIAVLERREERRRSLPAVGTKAAHQAHLRRLEKRR